MDNMHLTRLGQIANTLLKNKSALLEISLLYSYKS